MRHGDLDELARAVAIDFVRRLVWNEALSTELLGA
jgi:predicted nucleotidyltransferase